MENKNRDSNFVRNLLLFTIGLLFLLGILGALGGGSSSSSNNTPNSTNTNSDLNATVAKNINGVYITNNESAPWTDCMVGVNGGNGFGFSNPPYKTQAALTFVAGKKTLVSYSDMTTEDGTMFDPSTHAVNSVVIMCSQHSTGARYWSWSSE